MDTFFQSNPGPELAHRAPPRLPGLRRRRSCCAIGERLLSQQNYRFARRGARGLRRVPRAIASAQPQFANARSVRNALDRRAPAPGEPPVRRQRPRVHGRGPDDASTPPTSAPAGCSQASRAKNHDMRVHANAPQAHHALNRFLIEQLAGIPGAQDLGALLRRATCGRASSAHLRHDGQRALGGYPGGQQRRHQRAGRDPAERSTSWATRS